MKQSIIIILTSMFCFALIFISYCQGANDYEDCKNEPTEKIEHIFNLSEHQSLNFGGVVLFHNRFQVTPISNEEFGVVFATHCELEESYKIIKSFYANIENFGTIEEKKANFFILNGYLKYGSDEFFYGESDGKAYTVCDFMHDGKVFVYVQICDLEKIQMALDEYDEVKKQEAEQKERERQEKLKKEAEEAQIFPF